MNSSCRTCKNVLICSLPGGYANCSSYQIKTLEQKDAINPFHYQGDIECIDAIKASMPAEQYKGYLKGNIIKYIWRYEKKGGKEDLLKMWEYSKMLIKEVE